MKKRRIDWIDYGRGICMILVILYHTWAYYVKDGNLILEWIEPFFLTLFFLISGYLTNLSNFNTKGSFLSIFKRLIVPYLIFTAIIWIPKNIAHGASLDYRSALFDILGGYASWFIAALICAKILLTCILSISKSIKFLWIVTILMWIIGLILLEYVPFKLPWYLGEGLVCLLYLSIGITYRQYEERIPLVSLKCLIFLCLVYVLILYINNYVYTFSKCIYQMNLGKVDIYKAFIYVIISIYSLYIVLNILKRFPQNIHFLTYIGKNSLVYYFLNTGALTILCIISEKIGFNYNGSTFRAIIIFCIVLFLMFIASKLIKKYAPWMIGEKF